MNVVKILDSYIPIKRKIEMLKAELNYLERTKVKTSNLSDEIMGQRESMIEKYSKIIERKEELKVIIAEEEVKLVLVDAAFELLEVTHPHYANMLKLRYFQNKTYEFISESLGYSTRSITRNLPKAEEELKSILQYSSLAKIA